MEDHQNKQDFFVARTAEPQADQERMAESDELKTILSALTPEQAPASLRRRVLNSYRAEFRMLPLWRRLLTAQISVPAPVAVFGAILLLIAGGLALASKRSLAQQTPPTVVERVRTVEVPVAKTEIETHVVYRNRWRVGPKRVGAGLGSAESRNLTLMMVNQDNQQGFFTGTDLSGFRPNRAMRLTVTNKAEDK